MHYYNIAFVSQSVVQGTEVAMNSCEICILRVRLFRII